MDKNKNFFTRMFGKEYWKAHWKSALINFSIYASIFIATVLIDLLTKNAWFIKGYRKEIPSDPYYVSSFVRIWSVFHAGTTINLGLNNAMLHVVSIVIILATLIASLFIEDKKYRFVIAALAFIAGGSFGNMYDRFAFGGVRDIINLPWSNRGTFNFADLWLVIGSILAVLLVAIFVLISVIKSKKEAKNRELENEYSNSDKEVIDAVSLGNQENSSENINS
ncbi:signal peptidase II [Mycoplasma struthionis]|uniref:Signal peptidase II n=1 Tax=Mycoplasma struthionis TaxID=538220 RepID=A0A502M8R7_9MOLU|nr:signal peptidase II [Mycoplasma struthionis]TPI01841.1 signal peptidase II [Mycoplasma struthionis]